MSTDGQAPLEGAVVLLTGSGRGIGRASALELARNGCRVHVSDLELDAATAVADEIRSAGGFAVEHQCDVATETSVKAMFDAVGAAEGRIDVLVNNAGIYPMLPFEDTTIADYDRVMDVNMRSVFLCTMAVLPLMRTHGGSIITLSSGAGTLESIRLTPTARALPLYGASKAAVDRWVLGVAHELAAMGIASNVLWPGAFVRTRGLEALGLPDDDLTATVQPEFVVPALVHLARQRIGGIVGQLVKASEFNAR